MFTGIITDLGEVVRVEDRAGIKCILIRTHFDLEHTAIGASIACDGCCLTVVEKEDDCFAVEVTSETLDKTTIGAWQEGTKVNLEQSLKLGDEMGGHIVSGHVDAAAVIEAIEPDGEAHRLTFRVPDDLARYFVPKGSVAVNGISLTVNEVEGSCFSVMIIPHTRDVTSAGQWKQGDKVNIEIDMLARYVARIVGAMAEQKEAA